MPAVRAGSFIYFRRIKLNIFEDFNFRIYFTQQSVTIAGLILPQLGYQPLNLNIQRCRRGNSRAVAQAVYLMTDFSRFKFTFSQQPVVILSRNFTHFIIKHEVFDCRQSRLIAGLIFFHRLTRAVRLERRFNLSLLPKGV